MTYTPPPPDCPLCPRLAAFREANRVQYPDFFNAPVPSFGDMGAEFLVVGLAPGLKGANRTGRPFTGDYAGIILYAALAKSGFAKGPYDPEKVAKKALPAGRGFDHAADGFRLRNCRVTNGVRCVPQANKPETSEIRTCNTFLKAEIAAMPNLKVILSLGLVSHKAVLMALGLRQSAFAFSHAASHAIPGAEASAARAPQKNAPAGVTLLNSYHTSRYNINTGALTQEMFDKVIASARKLLD